MSDRRPDWRPDICGYLGDEGIKCGCYPNHVCESCNLDRPSPRNTFYCGGCGLALDGPTSPCPVKTVSDKDLHNKVDDPVLTAIVPAHCYARHGDEPGTIKKRSGTDQRVRIRGVPVGVRREAALLMRQGPPCCRVEAAGQCNEHTGTGWRKCYPARRGITYNPVTHVITVSPTVCPHNR